MSRRSPRHRRWQQRRERDLREQRVSLARAVARRLRSDRLWRASNASWRTQNVLFGVLAAVLVLSRVLREQWLSAVGRALPDPHLLYASLALVPLVTYALTRLHRVLPEDRWAAQVAGHVAVALPLLYGFSIVPGRNDSDAFSADAQQVLTPAQSEAAAAGVLVLAVAVLAFLCAAILRATTRLRWLAPLPALLGFVVVPVYGWTTLGS